ncbi:GreA/GreB family elongation factor [Massilia yuzhufengensis]|nr:GreA/GreB family elongation factor [Massilia yuzhufengensis]
MCSKPDLGQHDVAVLKKSNSSRPAHAAGRGLAASVPPEPGRGARHVAPGATVEYRIRGEQGTRSVLITSEQDARVERVSMLAPLGRGLLGHPEGSTVGIALPLGRALLLDIVAVRTPAR